VPNLHTAQTVLRAVLLGMALAVAARPAAAQGLTGTLIGTVKDAQGGVLTGVIVRVSSPALIGGPAIVRTDERGQMRVPALPPGSYQLDIELAGFTTVHENDMRIGAGATVERTVTLLLASRQESIVVDGSGSRIEARNPGFGTRFGPGDLERIPTRRASMFDFMRAAPGISPTSPSSGTVTTVSAFGSGTNENQFLIDGTNFTCPCNGIARAEAGVDFIQEVQVQSAGMSAEYGNVQGAVINVVMKQGSDRFRMDAAGYGQTASLTSAPVTLGAGAAGDTGYRRARYRDTTITLGGPGVRKRVWFFAGYEYLRDADSQPGTLANHPRSAASDRVFAKATWQLAPGWRIEHSFHDERQDMFDQPTIVTPFDATLHRHATVPATTFAHLTHTSSSNTVWEVLAGRFVFSQQNQPATGDLTTASRLDSATGITTGAPSSIANVTIARTTAKATVTRYQPRLLGTNHELKGGVQIEAAGHHAINAIPTNVRFIDSGGKPVQSISADPAHVGGRFVAASTFGADTLHVRGRLTISAGLRFDHTRAISQDLSAVDLAGQSTDQTVQGLGTLYTWNLWSPRLGLTSRLTADGRTMLRASYGRFNQGVLTGELEPFHPGGATVLTTGFDPSTAAYTRLISKVSPADLQIDRGMRAPHTDELSLGVDREMGARVAVAAAYIAKRGSDFIGWTDVGGQYAQVPVALKDGSATVDVFKLTNAPSDRRYQLTNPDGYSLTYDGLVVVVEKRRARGWQALASYTFSRAYGLQAASGATAAGAQVSTVSPPPALTFGRDPNDLINARGRLPNDRPHVFRVMGAVDIPRTGLAVAANFQAFSGKPWAATALINPQNGQQRVLIEPRGSRRLSSQSILDVRVSRMFFKSRQQRVELLLDVLNALNDTAEESIASDDRFSAAFGVPSTFVDPRRAMLGIRVSLGR
jgi:hypothetical protein